MARHHWLIYALGGGFGHLTRACALARCSQAQVTILTNSPYAGIVRAALPELDIITGQGLEEILRRIADVLVVDAFPRGLVGELADISALPGLKVLVKRDLNPIYVAKYQLEDFIARSYDLVLSPGDGSANAIITAPWLIRSRHELPDRLLARQLLGLSVERPCIVICAAGKEDERAWYGEAASYLAARDCDVRCIAPTLPPSCPPECWLSYWPAMDLYAAADVLIGGAGYNTVYEAAACGVPLVCRPWPRKYDRQERRARQAGATIVMDAEQAARAAFDRVENRPELLRPDESGRGREESLRHENGAVQAAQEIAGRLKRFLELRHQ